MYQGDIFPDQRGAAAELIRRADWAGTSLGEPPEWPASLKISLAMVLDSPYPMILFWGEELFCFYNDAFAANLGDNRRPGSAPGRKGPEVFPEIWPVIQPLIASVLHGGDSQFFEDRLLPVFRNGRMEQVYTTFSHSPVRDEHGVVRGVLVVTRESTPRISKFHQIVEHSLGPVAIFAGPDLVIEDANQAALNLWRTDRRAIGRKYAEVAGDQTDQTIHWLLRRVFADGVAHHGFEQRIYHVDESGTKKNAYFNLEVKPFRGSDGRVSGLMMLATDVTSHVVAKQPFLVVEDEMRIAMSAANQGYWNIDPQSGSFKCNQRTRDLFGFHSGEITITSLVKVIHHEDRAYVVQAMKAALEDPDAGRLDIAFRVAANGAGFRHLRCTGLAYFNEYKLPYRFSGIVQDISESRRTQEELREKEALLRVAAVSGQVGIWSYDLTTGKVYATEGWRNLFGIPADAEVTFDMFVEAVHPDDRERTVKVNNDVMQLKDGSPDYDHEFRARGSDNRYATWLRARGKVYTDDAGRPARFTGAVVDITKEKNTQSALTYRKALLEAQSNAIPDGIAIVDMKGSLLTCNKRFMEIWQIPAHIVESDDRRAPLHAAFSRVADPEAFVERIRFLYANQQESGREEILLTDGTVLERYGKAVVGEDGTHFGWAWYFRDITQQKKDALELERSHERFLLLAKATQDAIWDWNLETDQVWWSEGFITLFNDNQGEMVASIDRWTGRLHPEDLERVTGSIYGVIRERGRSWSQEYRFRKADGSYAVVFDRGYVLYNKEGQAYRMLGSMQDITVRKQIETALKESEERFRLLADFVPQIVWTARPDGYIDYYNKRWYEFTGFQEVFGDQSWIPLLHPDDVDFSLKTWHRSVQTGEPYYVEYRFRDAATGTYRWFLGKALAIRDNEGRVIKWFGTSTDIHDQKQFTENLESQVRQQTEELRRSNEDLQQFAHVTSHDLKEPLRKIKTFEDILQREFAHLLPDEGKLFLNKIGISAARLNAMIDGVLLYSSIDGAVEERELVDLNATFEQIESALEIAIREKRAEVRRDDLPAVTGLPTQIYQLFYNLVSNALKFSRAHVPPVITVTATEVSDIRRDDGTIIGNGYSISISDNGIGFDPTHAQKIFTAFTRLNTKDRYEGTGLGLALCKKIVLRHGGAIEATSAEGRGATFTVTLPG